MYEPNEHIAELLSTLPVSVLINRTLPGRPREMILHVNNEFTGDIPQPMTEKTEKMPNMELYSPLHYHKKLEILVFLEGNAEVFVNGKRYMAGEDNIVIINSYEPHCIYYCAKEPFTRAVISFEQDKLLSDTLLPYFQSRYDSGQQIRHYILPDEPIHVKLYYHIKQVLQDVQRRDIGWEASVKAECLLFMREILKSDFFVQNQSANRHYINFISKLNDYLTENFRQNISLADVSQAMNYSREYFCRLFKSYFNMPFHQYLNYYRIMHAKSLINNTDSGGVRLSYIASDVGYNDTCYFTRMFKRYVGVSPSEYLKKCRQK